MRITDEILMKFLLNESSAKENTAVQQWLDANAANRRHYAQIESIWTSSRKLAENPVIDEQQAWKRFKERVDSAPQTEVQDAPVVKPLNPGFRWIRIAAVLVLAASVVFFNKYIGQGRYTDITTDQLVVTQILPDGSEITLNKHSNLSYANNFKEDRSIRLQQGEAFFKVTPDKIHPFIVDADGVSVEVVGTEFNVKHLNDTTEVIVESGIVKVSRGKEFVELRRGEKVIISSNATGLIKQQNTDQLYNFYQSKTLIAVNTPLLKIIEALNKAYGTNISFKRPETGQLTLTTTFKNQSIDQILAVICETMNLKSERQKDQIVLFENQ